MSITITDRRIGRFVIPTDFIERDPKAVRLAMGTVIPLEARVRVWAGDVEYTALGEQFKAIEVGDIVPEYVAEFRKQDDGDPEFTGWKQV